MRRWLSIIISVAACSSAPQPTADAGATEAGPTHQRDGGVARRDAGAGAADAGITVACPDPGFVPLRRLGRRAFGNALADLLGVNPNSAAPWPEDQFGHGFDHIGEVLSFSPVHLEQGELIIDAALAQALAMAPQPELRTFPGEFLDSEVGTAIDSGGWNLSNNGSLSIEFPAPVAGTYHLRAFAYGEQAGDQVPQMTLSLNGAELRRIDVYAVNDPQRYQVEVRLEARSHEFSVAFINDFEDPDHPDPTQRDRNLVIHRLEVEGPFDAPVLSARNRLLHCDPESGLTCARSILGDFASKAWRRALATAELGRLVALAGATQSAGASWEEAIVVGLKAILLSPNFLYIIERTQPEPQRLSGHELATRLALFLWDSTPDAALFSAASSGALDHDEGVAETVATMLADPRSQRLISTFFAQWLHLLNLEGAQPDYHFFPDFDEELRASMRRETDLLLAWLFNGDRPLTDLLVGAPTFLDARLGAHYGLSAQGTAVADNPGWFQRDGSEAQRGGILTHASILTLTSSRVRASPVKRGKWVLERLLCDAPPPPPPGAVESFDEEEEGDLRARLARHRSDPACASCHQSMDPIGLGIEAFDGIGSLLAEPPDVSGSLPDGRTFAGVIELQTLLAEDPRLAECFIRQVLIYALARAPRALDRCHADELAQGLGAEGLRIRALIARVATSRVFTHSRQRREAE